jgi:hypothetical protein
LFAVTAAPLWVRLVFQNCDTVCPALKLQVRLQPLIASPRLVIVTFAPNPPDHCDVTA